VRDVGALGEAEVLLGVKLPLELQQLLGGEGRPPASRLAACASTASAPCLRALADLGAEARAGRHCRGLRPRRRHHRRRRRRRRRRHRRRRALVLAHVRRRAAALRACETKGTTPEFIIPGGASRTHIALPPPLSPSSISLLISPPVRDLSDRSPIIGTSLSRPLVTNSRNATRRDALAILALLLMSRS
jgi:hypothetical protein